MGEVLNIKAQRYEAILCQIAEGSDAVPAEPWRHLAAQTLAEFGVKANYRPDVRHEWSED
jgi:hypothetical protein